MRIYLDENVYPSLQDDKLVFFEKEIELGDWKEGRKKTVDVPMSNVPLDFNVFNKPDCPA